MKHTGKIGLPILAAISWILLFFYMYAEHKKMGFVYIIASICYVIFGWWLGKQYDIAKYYSEKDSLTQVYNRRFIIYTLTRLLDKLGKKEALCIILMDVDRFKEINDTYGHDKGDEVLKFIGDALMNSIRKKDFVGRWGGDEFIIVVPNAGRKDSSLIIKRIETKLKDTSKMLPISLSIGVAIYPEDATSIDTLVKIADCRMYDTKFNKKTLTQSQIFE